MSSVRAEPPGDDVDKNIMASIIAAIQTAKKVTNINAPNINAQDINEPNINAPNINAQDINEPNINLDNILAHMPYLRFINFEDQLFQLLKGSLTERIGALVQTATRIRDEKNSILDSAKTNMNRANDEKTFKMTAEETARAAFNTATIDARDKAKNDFEIAKKEHKIAAKNLNAEIEAFETAKKTSDEADIALENVSNIQSTYQELIMHKLDFYETIPRNLNEMDTIEKQVYANMSTIDKMKNRQTSYTDTYLKYFTAYADRKRKYEGATRVETIETSHFEEFAFIDHHDEYDRSIMGKQSGGFNPNIIKNIPSETMEAAWNATKQGATTALNATKEGATTALNATKEGATTALNATKEFSNQSITTTRNAVPSVGRRISDIRKADSDGAVYYSTKTDIRKVIRLDNFNFTRYCNGYVWFLAAWIYSPELGYFHLKDLDIHEPNSVNPRFFWNFTKEIQQKDGSTIKTFKYFNKSNILIGDKKEPQIQLYMDKQPEIDEQPSSLLSNNYLEQILPKNGSNDDLIRGIYHRYTILSDRSFNTIFSYNSGVFNWVIYNYEYYPNKYKFDTKVTPDLGVPFFMLGCLTPDKKVVFYPHLERGQRPFFMSKDDYMKEMDFMDREEEDAGQRAAAEEEARRRAADEEEARRRAADEEEARQRAARRRAAKKIVDFLGQKIRDIKERKRAEEERRRKEDEDKKTTAIVAAIENIKQEAEQFDLLRQEEERRRQEEERRRQEEAKQKEDELRKEAAAVAAVIQQERLRQEEEERLREERLRQEEEDRLRQEEEERLRKERLRQEEEERLRQEAAAAAAVIEQERLRQERLHQERLRQERLRQEEERLRQEEERLRQEEEERLRREGEDRKILAAILASISQAPFGSKKIQTIFDFINVLFINSTKSVSTIIMGVEKALKYHLYYERLKEYMSLLIKKSDKTDITTVNIKLFGDLKKNTTYKEDGNPLLPLTIENNRIGYLKKYNTAYDSLLNPSNKQLNPGKKSIGELANEYIENIHNYQESIVNDIQYFSIPINYMANIPDENIEKIEDLPIKSKIMDIVKKCRTIFEFLNKLNNDEKIVLNDIENVRKKVDETSDNPTKPINVLGQSLIKETNDNNDKNYVNTRLSNLYDIFISQDKITPVKNNLDNKKRAIKGFYKNQEKLDIKTKWYITLFKLLNTDFIDKIKGLWPDIIDYQNKAIDTSNFKRLKIDDIDDRNMKADIDAINKLNTNDDGFVTKLLVLLSSLKTKIEGILYSAVLPYVRTSGQLNETNRDNLDKVVRDIYSTTKSVKNYVINHEKIGENPGIEDIDDGKTQNVFFHRKMASNEKINEELLSLGYTINNGAEYDYSKYLQHMYNISNTLKTPLNYHYLFLIPYIRNGILKEYSITNEEITKQFNHEESNLIESKNGGEFSLGGSDYFNKVGTIVQPEAKIYDLEYIFDILQPPGVSQTGVAKPSDVVSQTGVAKPSDVANPSDVVSQTGVANPYAGISANTTKFINSRTVPQANTVVANQTNTENVINTPTVENPNGFNKKTRKNSQTKNQLQENQTNKNPNLKKGNSANQQTFGTGRTPP